ncbi:TLC domain [Pelomyxa schiedti]|nr:TLC domain [Pelomyxa schiedti]
MEALVLTTGVLLSCQAITSKVGAKWKPNLGLWFRIRMLIVGAILGIGILLSCVSFSRLFTVIKERQFSDPMYPNVFDIKIAIYAFIAINFVQNYFQSLLTPLAMKLVAAPGSSEQLKQNASKITASLWKAVYHIISVGAAFVLFSRAEWFMLSPKCILGPSECVTAMWKQYPHSPHCPYLKEFFLGQLGYYFHGIFMTFTMPKQRNFLEMAIHHLFSAALIMIAYFVQNAAAFGVEVLVLHDLTDIPLSLLRCVIQTEHRHVTVILYVVTLIMWIAFRLFLFPIYLVLMSCIWPLAFPSSAIGLRWEIAHGWIPQIGLLSLLMGLHLSWFFRLLKIAHNFLLHDDKTHKTLGHHADDDAVSPIT